MSTSNVNIAAPLVAQAQSQPHTPAIIEPRGTHRPQPRRERRLTFQELDAESDRLARGFLHLGFRRGMRTVLMVPPSLEFYSLTFALFKLGAIVVLIDPGMGVANLGKCLAEAEPEAFVGVPRAHLARLLLRWARKTLRLRVVVGPGWFFGIPTLRHVRHAGASGDPVLAPTTADEMAAILFTSGSTGVAKGAVYTHGIFAAQVEMLRRMYDIRPGEMDLPTFPLFGLFGPALGMTAVVPEMDATRPAMVDPERIINTIQHYRVTNMFGSPALLRRVGDWVNPPLGVMDKPDRPLLPTLRRVISAGAPVPASVIERFVPLLSDGVQVHTPYGATESLPVSTIGSAEVLRETAALTAQGRGVCVGRPVEGMSVEIIRIRDDAIPTWSDDLRLPAGEIGEIVVRGPVVTASYYNRPEATALHKIHDPQGGPISHRMGDVGYLDDQGRIWFCGRKSQRVVTSRGTLFTIPCEGVFNEHCAVERSALVGVPLDGDVEPVLCVQRRGFFEREPEALLQEQLLALGAQHPHTAGIRRILFPPEFPVDIRHNSKIFREKLAVWAKRQVG